MIGKKYRSMVSGEVYTVESIQGDNVIFDKGKDKVSRLLDSQKYEEVINLNDFIGVNTGLISQLSQTIKTSPISTDFIEDNSYQTSVRVINADEEIPQSKDGTVLPYSKRQQEEEIARKYNSNYDPYELARRQQESLAKYADEELENIIPPHQQQNSQYNNQYNNRPNKVEDPVFSLFRKSKRVQELKLDLVVKEKIPRIEFIQFMEDSYEVSIIDFFADEITNNLLNNPEQLKSKIKQEIMNLVYPKKPSRKISKKSTDTAVDTKKANKENED